MKKLIFVFILFFLSCTATQKTPVTRVICDEAAIKKYVSDCIKLSGVSLRDSLNYKYYYTTCEKEARAKYCKKEIVNKK